MNSSMKSSSSLVSARVGALAALGLVVLAVCLVGRCSAQVGAEPSDQSGAGSPADLTAAAGHHYGKSHGGGGHGKYYMYAEVPKKGAYKMGFKRGNEKHTIERKESVHGTHVESYFKWHDKKGKGSHKIELKHGDSKHHHY